MWKNSMSSIHTCLKTNSTHIKITVRNTIFRITMKNETKLHKISETSYLQQITIIPGSIFAKKN